MDGLDHAVEIFGTQTELAAALGIKSPSISEWRMRGSIPFHRCEDIQRVTKGKVTLAELCPDIAKAFAKTRDRKRKAA